MSSEPAFIPEGSGERFEVIGGDIITLKVTGDQSDGSLLIIETDVPPQGGRPRHSHSFESETFYIVEGEFEFEIGEYKIAVKRGDVLFAPRDVPHRFQNLGQTPGTLMIVCQPSGFEDFVREFSSLPADAPASPAEMAAIASRYGITFV